MDQQNQNPQTEVETTKIVPGKISFGIDGIGKPTPAIFLRVSGAIRKFCVGLSTAVLSAPSTVISATHTTTVCWWLGIIVIATYSLDGLLGVQTTDDKK